jgi:hypothetical protein
MDFFPTAEKESMGLVLTIRVRRGSDNSASACRKTSPSSNHRGGPLPSGINEDNKRVLDELFK